MAVLDRAIGARRRLNREEKVDIVYFGNVRSSFDTSKIVAPGRKAAC
ncbi:MAG: hypothetical protein AAF563_09495 [Pseudomonadota bacterium]